MTRRQPDPTYRPRRPPTPSPLVGFLLAATAPLAVVVASYPAVTAAVVATVLGVGVVALGLVALARVLEAAIERGVDATVTLPGTDLEVTVGVAPASE